MKYDDTLGGTFSHDCGLARSIGYYIEGILPLLLFAKENTKIQFSGITNDELDLSVDIIRSVTIPLLTYLGIPGLNLTIKKRGAAPKGGGVIEFSCNYIRELSPIFMTEVGLIKRIRGLAYCTKVSPSILPRVIDASRQVLNHLIPDVYIHTDNYQYVHHRYYDRNFMMVQ